MPDSFIIENPNPKDHLETEWLLTNGLGGYAMGTVLGVNTRRYHGLLVAATNPPVGRVVALHSMIEQLVIPKEDGSEEVIDLSTQMFVGEPPDGEPMLHPDGWKRLVRFEFAPNHHVAWTFEVPRGYVIKTLEIVGSSAVFNYYITNCPRASLLRIRPIVVLRPFHTLGAIRVESDSHSHNRVSEVSLSWNDGRFDFRTEYDMSWVDDQQAWHGFNYVADAARGFPSIEDAWSPGYFLSDRAEMGWWTIRATYGEGKQSSMKTQRTDDPALAPLHQAARSFVVLRDSPQNLSQNSIIAGYPWFADWGRDAMISLPGLLLCTRRFDEARSVLETFANNMRGGLIPNRFDDDGGEAHYNTVDASLWFVYAVWQYVRATGLPPSPSGRGAGGEGEKGHLPPQLLKFARELRQKQTDAERLLWGMLRDRRFCRFKFRRQHPFDPYIIDFFCKEASLAIELDGGQHNEPAEQARDTKRTQFIESQGIRVIRFWNHDVLADLETVLEAIHLALTPALSQRERGHTNPTPTQSVGLMGACRDIIRAYRDGTDFGIHMDPADHLITAGDESTQLTWMDAQRDGHVFTPRHGKAVEINALWHNALLCAADMTEDDREANEWRELAGQVAESFRAQFWWDEKQCLHDVLIPQSPRIEIRGDNGKLRPNQIFAVSLPYSPLTREQQQEVVNTVRERFLTPYGLRTLDRDDPDYCPRYEGDMWSRDKAYHNGTVWPWLIGPYCEAVMRVNDFSDESKREARACIRPLLDEMTRTSGRTCLGQIAEIYDGDPPHTPDGCPAQAWSVAEVLRILDLVEH